MTNRKSLARRPGQRPGGFTLVELLVVIGIIALLIGMLLPTLNSAREKGRSVACGSNLRQIGTAMFMYVNDHRTFPAAGHLVYAAGAYRQSPIDWVYWGPTLALAPVGFTADDYKLENSPMSRYLGGTLTPEMLRCPSDSLLRRGNEKYPFSYSMNCRLGPGATDTPAAEQAVKITQVKGSSEKMMFFEEDNLTLDDPYGFPDFNATRPTTTNLLSIRHDLRDAVADPPYGTLYTTLPNPSRRGNLAFVDGSVRLLTREEMHRPATCCPKYPDVKVSDFAVYGPQ